MVRGKGVLLLVEEIGQGPPLLLVMGLGASLNHAVQIEDPHAFNSAVLDFLGDG